MLCEMLYDITVGCNVNLDFNANIYERDKLDGVCVYILYEKRNMARFNIVCCIVLAYNNDEVFYPQTMCVPSYIRQKDFNIACMCVPSVSINPFVLSEY